jgi:serine/threonine protein kinase/ABC-type phosphate/phosphonate transport system substrate-binding protein
MATIQTYRPSSLSCILAYVLLLLSPCCGTRSSGSEHLALPWNNNTLPWNNNINDILPEDVFMTPRDLELEDGTLCDLPLAFDANRHKRTYTVGVLAIRGPEAAYAEFNKTFSEYLTKVVSSRFIGEIEFVLKPLNFITLFSDVEDKLVDYIYVNPSAYSCIESEYDANSLASQVSKRVIGGEVYNLKKFGGVIAALAERDDISSIQDLNNKIVAAASISGLGSGQMQFKEMIDHGMNHLQDPKQLVFTSNQGKVVNGILNGDFDVGFVRTDQLERSKDADGNPVDLSKFKIIDPKPDLNIDGVPFPFESSTDLYAEWNIAALTHVDTEISRAVQRAMFRISDYAAVGNAILACYEQNINNTQYCDDLPLQAIYDGPIRCDMDRETALLAVEASSNGKYSAWTTSLSYMQLRSMQEATGFISMEESTNIWRCIRSAEIYDAISCPAGALKRTKDAVANGCTDVDLSCGEEYQCICRPCEIPFELVCVNSVLVGENCVSLAIFLPSIIIPILIVVGVLVHYYVEHKRKQSDSIWVVKPEDLEFDDPPTVVGRGTFGLVLLADYRGTQVAVKRVIPPNNCHSNKFFDVSTKSSQSGSTGDVYEEDVEVGLKSSMHPRILTVAHSKNKLSSSFQDGYKSGHPNSFGIAASWCSPWGSRTEEDKQNAQLKEMFINEIRQLAGLRHPCITTVMGAVMPSVRDEPMLVMEYMTHGSLRDCMEDDSIQLKPEQMLAILQDVAQGLRFLHTASSQVIHGDLKASNVLLDTNFCAKVTDFGLSAKKQIGAVGTPYWMAPELLQGGISTNSAASDVYSFGIVVYELYSQKSPYEGEPYDEVIQEVCDPQIRKRPPVPLNCPVKIAKLMQDCVEHSPQDRPGAEQLDMILKVEMKVKERTSRLEALNRELGEANKKIASASEMQLQHFACMSHEIRTPLNCVIGMSSLLEETELNPMQKEGLEMIVSSGKLLRQIVDDVLDCKYNSATVLLRLHYLKTSHSGCFFSFFQIRNSKVETLRYSSRTSIFKKLSML